MRAILTILILIVIVVLILVLTGMISLRQTPEGTIAVDTRDVEVGTTTREVEVPVINLRDRDAPTANESEPLVNRP